MEGDPLGRGSMGGDCVSAYVFETPGPARTLGAPGDGADGARHLSDGVCPLSRPGWPGRWIGWPHPLAKPSTAAEGVRLRFVQAAFHPHGGVTDNGRPVSDRDRGDPESRGTAHFGLERVSHHAELWAHPDR